MHLLILQLEHIVLRFRIYTNIIYNYQVLSALRISTNTKKKNLTSVNLKFFFIYGLYTNKAF